MAIISRLGWIRWKQSAFMKEERQSEREYVSYVLVHEIVHLLERTHNDRFRELMDCFLPQWRTYRDTLNHAPLAHADWGY